MCWKAIFNIFIPDENIAILYECCFRWAVPLRCVSAEDATWFQMADYISRYLTAFHALDNKDMLSWMQHQTGFHIIFLNTRL